MEQLTKSEMKQIKAKGDFINLSTGDLIILASAFVFAFLSAILILTCFNDIL